MDKIEEEMKLNKIVHDDSLALEMLREYLKTIKKLWCAVIVLFGMLLCSFVYIVTV